MLQQNTDRKSLPQAGSRVLVLGLGSTGLSCMRFLTDLAVDVAVADSRMEPPNLAELHDHLPDAAVFLGGFPEQALKAADMIVISPGIDRATPVIQQALRRGTEVVGDIELFARCVKAPVMAITGSNGKSTVTTLLGEMAKASGRRVAVGGNIGTPVLDLLDDQIDLYILELSSFQLESTQSLDAAVATVLNVSPDHMDRYASVEDYRKAKARVFGANGTMVVNRDDSASQAFDAEGRDVVSFGLSAPQGRDFGLIRGEDGSWLAQGGERILLSSELRLLGIHNQANVLAALAMGDAMGFGRAAMVMAVKQFQGLEHRTQWVARQDNITWVNDSKATNVGATVAALEGLPGNLILIAGGDGKDADFTPLAPAIAQHVGAVVLIGRDADLIQAVLPRELPCVRAADMSAAVRCARELAHAQDTVLLSPACASFDMYSGYEERGRDFMCSVEQLLS